MRKIFTPITLKNVDSRFAIDSFSFRIGLLFSALFKKGLYFNSGEFTYSSEQLKRICNIVDSRRRNKELLKIK